MNTDKFKEWHALITSGPTRGYIDAVRYISNKSSGQLGSAIAADALRKGAFVTFVYGKESALPDISLLGKEFSRRLSLIEIETMNDLISVIQNKLAGKAFDVIIHAMAVLDYTPEEHTMDKISSKKEHLTVKLKKTPKIIKKIRALWPHAYLVGFKLEVNVSHEVLWERARTFSKENNIDLVVANDQNEIFDGKHRGYIMSPNKDFITQCDTKGGISKNLIDVVYNAVSK